MKLSVLVFKNLQLGCFTTPVFDDHDAEAAAVQLARGIKQACLNGDAEKFKAYHNMEMYYLGTFDDVTGECSLHDAKLILKCEECFVEVKKQNA